MYNKKEKNYQNTQIFIDRRSTISIRYESQPDHHETPKKKKFAYYCAVAVLQIHTTNSNVCDCKQHIWTDLIAIILGPPNNFFMY